MRVYVLHFENLSRLTGAFDLVLEDPEVASCMIEPERLRLRFLGPAVLADRLVERVYGGGGLLWCSRHDVIETADEPDPRASHPRTTPLRAVAMFRER